MSRNKLLDEIDKSKYNDAMKDYPIFNESYRNTLNNIIYSNYKYEQIAIHNEDIWLNELRSHMWLMMPKYNLLYNSLGLLDKFDPLMTYEFWREFEHDGTAHTERDIDVNGNVTSDGKTTNDRNTTDKKVFESTEVTDGKTTSDTDSNGTSSTDSSGSSTSSEHTDTSRTTHTYDSDTPQGNLWTEGNPPVRTLQYLSNYTQVNENGETDTKGQGTTQENSDTTTKNHSETDGTNHSQTDYNSTENDTGTVKDVGTSHNTQDSTNRTDDDYDSVDHHDEATHEWGSNGGSYSELVAKFRELAIDIDRQIVQELDDLFATVFDIADLLDSSHGYRPPFVGWNPFIF